MAIENVPGLRCAYRHFQFCGFKSTRCFIHAERGAEAGECFSSADSEKIKNQVKEIQVSIGSANVYEVHFFFSVIFFTGLFAFTKSFCIQ
jgi:hypothetical protein